MLLRRAVNAFTERASRRAPCTRSRLPRSEPDGGRGRCHVSGEESWWHDRAQVESGQRNAERCSGDTDLAKYVVKIGYEVRQLRSITQSHGIARSNTRQNGPEAHGSLHD